MACIKVYWDNMKGSVAKYVLIFVLAFMPFLKVYAVGEFKMTINTDPLNVGSVGMTIPVNPNYSPNYTIDWGDGNIDAGMTSDATHTYATPGTYQVSITGDVAGLYFNNVSGMKEKVVSIDQWGTIQWLSMEQAFAGVPNLSIHATDMPDLTGVTNMSSMFANIPIFSDVGGQMGNWDTSTIQNMEALFINSAGFNENIANWDTSNVTNMSSVFLGATSFNQNISGWDTSQVTTMQQMFDGATSFNQPIGSWNTVHVTDMHGMFASATAFNQALSFDTTHVTNMSRMFEAANSFNSDITFNTAAVTDMSYMFHEATAFDQAITFSTQMVTDMSYMFADTSFNQNIASWDTSSVANMSNMFAHNAVFNQNISGWDTSHVTDMSGMFNGASSFDQDIGLWNYESVTTLDNFLTDANISYQNYDSLLQAWDTQNTQDNLSTQVSQGIYCDSSAYRSHLILTKTWSIIDVGTMSGCPSPRVVRVTSSDPNGNYNTGDVVHIQIVFNESVNVGSGLAPTLILETGTTDAVATLTGGSGTDTLTFAFTVLSSHTSTDLEYTTTNALAGVLLEDVVNASVKARTTLPTLNSVNSLAGNKNITINQSVVAPTQSTSVSVQTGSWSLPTFFSGTAQRPYVINGSCEYNAFTQLLRPGQKHAQVIEIKKLLNKDLGVALGLTNLFDESTRKAVIRFQEKYKKEILEPARLKKGTGLWYNATIKKARELVCKI